MSMQVQKYQICKKDYVLNPFTSSCKNGKYLGRIIDKSVIICDEIIEETVPTNSNEKSSLLNTNISLYFN